MVSEPTVRFARRPVDGPITQQFGALDSGYAHRGTDFGVVVGTVVVAPADGVVCEFLNSWTTWQGQQVRSFGNGVCIDLGDGWWTLMAHLSQVIVNIGDRVRAGQVIGYSGNTGVSTGPHLHWQLSDTPSFPVDIAHSRDPLANIETEDPMEKYRSALRRAAAGPFQPMVDAYEFLKPFGYFTAWFAADGEPGPLDGQPNDGDDARSRRYCLAWLAETTSAQEAVEKLGWAV